MNDASAFDKKTSPLRWWILFFLFASGFLNYMDKGMLAILAPTIQKDLGFDDNAYADVQNWFQVAYTIATLASGFIVDRFGARISLALFVGWWSMANVLTGFTNSVLTLKIFRCVLGLGEAGNWTAAPKAVGNEVWLLASIPLERPSAWSSLRRSSLAWRHSAAVGRHRSS